MASAFQTPRSGTTSPTWSSNIYYLICILVIVNTSTDYRLQFTNTLCAFSAQQPSLCVGRGIQHSWAFWPTPGFIFFFHPSPPSLLEAARACHTHAFPLQLCLCCKRLQLQLPSAAMSRPAAAWNTGSGTASKSGHGCKFSRCCLRAETLANYPHTRLTIYEFILNDYHNCIYSFTAEFLG